MQKQEIVKITVAGLLFCVGLMGFSPRATGQGVPRGQGLVADSTELRVLREFYASTGGNTWNNRTNWLQGTTLAEAGTWYGVTVSNGDVTGLVSADNNLQGTLPASLGQLLGLTQLQFSGAFSLTGRIPGELGRLSLLRSLIFSSTGVSGAIPDEIGQLTNLTYLSFYNNRLSGPIPPELGKLTQLTALYLGNHYRRPVGHGNVYQGGIPAELGLLTNLITLELSLTPIGGTIPAELGKLVNLTFLELDGDELTGAVPATLANLRQLTYLNLSSNQLTQLPRLQVTNPGGLRLSVHTNFLDFGSLEAHLTGPGQHPFGSFSYSPQAPPPGTDTVSYLSGNRTQLTGQMGGQYNNYQWERLVGTTWTEVTGATNAVLVIPVAATATKGLYRARVTNSWVTGLTLYTKAVYARLLPAPPNPLPDSTGQGDPLRELRESLSGLNPNRITTGVLMNRMMLITDPHQFDGQIQDRKDKAVAFGNENVWMQQYWEYYNASLQQRNLKTVGEIEAVTQEKMQQGVVPLLMLKYRYDEFLPDAAEQGLITIDSVLERVYDGPDLSRSPYEQRQFFSVALAHSYGEGKVQVYVGKEFWFGNQSPPSTIRLYSGKSRGWQQVAMGSTVEIEIDVPYGKAKPGSDQAAARPTQPVYAYDPTDSSLAVAGVQYRTTQVSVLPDVALGLVASHFWGDFRARRGAGAPLAGGPLGEAAAIAWIKYANDNHTDRLRRPLVFVEGIDFEKFRNGVGGLGNHEILRTEPIPLSDFTDSYVATLGGYRNGTAGWNEMVDYNPEYKSLEKLPVLRQQLQAPYSTNFPNNIPGGNYDIIYLDFSDGASLIQHNAMVLAELLGWINQPANRTADAEETVVIGASMGGQVARFALAWMEQQGLCHNSKLYVSLDSPHRGANVPLGIQHLFDRLKTVWIGLDSPKEVVNNQLLREATMQMVVHHFDDKKAGSYRSSWQTWQASPGSYPSLLRKVAIANGSGQAEGQLGMFPGMRMLHTKEEFGTKRIVGRNHVYALPGANIDGENNVVFRYTRAFGHGKWHSTYVDYNTAHYDTAPGSSTRVAGDAEDKGNGRLKADWSSNTFMPTISALDVKVAGSIFRPDLDYDVRAIDRNKPNRSLYAFDAYFAADTTNEPHVQITDGKPSDQGNDPYRTDNSRWMQNELRESDHRMPAVLTGTYNFGNPYRHLLPSVQINNGGKLFVNNRTLPVDGGTAATRAKPDEDDFEVYTSNCATVVQINNGGLAQIGDGSDHSAILRMSANSLLDLHPGGTLNIGSGSILRIAAGATLVVRNGATLNLAGGRLYIDAGAYLCVENPSSIVVTSDGVYTVNPGVKFFANPALNLGTLACNQPPLEPYSVVADGVYILHNRNTGQVLEIGGGGSATLAGGTHANQWPRQGTANQQWTLTTTTQGVYKIINRNSGQALEIGQASTQPGAVANQWPYWGGNNQQWRLVTVEDAPNYVKIVNVNSGQVLEIGGGSPTNTQAGAWANQWPYQGDATSYEQQWELAPVTPPTASSRFPGVYTIRNVASSKVLEVSASGTNNGNVVQQWTNTGTASQQWSFEDAGSGLFNIKNRNSGLSLDVVQGGLENGSLVQQYGFGNGNNQKWAVDEVRPGVFRITAYHTILAGAPKSLDINVGLINQDGVQVQQWGYGGGTHQEWLLSFVTSNRSEQPAKAATAKPAARASAATANLSLYSNPASTEINVSLSLYPNPASTELNLSLSNAAALTAVTIRDLRGAEVAKPLVPRNGRLDISALPAGAYLVTVSDGIREYHQKFIKQ